MKDLHFPVPSEQYVDLSEITPKFKGLIIGYKETKAVGCIYYYDDSWRFIQDIDFSYLPSYCEDNILDLVRRLINNDICINFKVIEFA